MDAKEKATEGAKVILKKDSKSAEWIAKDALRELEGEKRNVLIIGVYFIEHKKVPLD
jgi:hypothetical protein